jgi:hypothetical protein
MPWKNRLNLNLEKMWPLAICMLICVIWANANAQSFEGPFPGKSDPGIIVNLRSLPRFSKSSASSKLLPSPSNIRLTRPTSLGKSQVTIDSITSSPEVDPSAASTKTGSTTRFMGDKQAVKSTQSVDFGPGFQAAFAIFTKTGTMYSQTDLYTFFGSLADGVTLSDPKVVYDQYSQRWVIMILGRDDNNSKSLYLIAASETSDPTQSWYKYSLNSMVSNGQNSGLYADYPGLGYDASAVYNTSNQWT